MSKEKEIEEVKELDKILGAKKKEKKQGSEIHSGSKNHVHGRGFPICDRPRI